MSLQHRILARFLLTFLIALAPRSAHGETLNASSVRFLTPNRAEVAYWAEFPEGQNALTFKVILNPGAEALTLFRQTAEFGIGAVRSAGNPFDEATIAPDEVISASILALPGSPDGAEVTVRRRQADKKSTLQLKFQSDSVSINTEYLQRVDPFLPDVDLTHLDCAKSPESCLQARIVVINSTRSGWGTSDGVFLGGEGFPADFKSTSILSPIGPNGGSGHLLHRIACEATKQLVVTSASVPLSTVSHPVLQVRLQWPESFVSPGIIKLQRIDRPNILVTVPAVYTGEKTADQATFKAARTSIVEVGPVEEIEVTRTVRPFSISLKDGILKHYEGRITVISATKKGPTKFDISYLTEDGWGEVSGSDPSEKPQPSASVRKTFVIDGTRNVFEKRKATPTDLRLRESSTINDDAQTLLDRIEMHLMAKDSQFGDSSVDGPKERGHLKTAAESLQAVMVFASAAAKKRELINESIRSTLAELANPQSPTILSQQDADNRIRDLRSIRDDLDQLLVEVVQQHNLNVSSNESAKPFSESQLMLLNTLYSWGS